MRFHFAALFCLGGLAACNQENTPPPQEPELTPASYDARDGARPATPVIPNDSPPAVEPSSPQRAAHSDAVEPARPGSAPVAPDNTEVNERDRNDQSLTPGDQGQNETDLSITQQIRQAVMADGSLSFTAKNVKIITQNGKVTLRGPVNTAQERSAIEAAARKVAGVTQVDSQLEVKK